MRSGLRGNLTVITIDKATRRKVAELAGPDGKPLRRPLDWARRLKDPEHPTAFVILGVEQQGSLGLKSKRQWNARQRWVCIPVED